MFWAYFGSRQHFWFLMVASSLPKVRTANCKFSCLEHILALGRISGFWRVLAAFQKWSRQRQNSLVWSIFWALAEENFTVVLDEELFGKTVTMYAICYNFGFYTLFQIHTPTFPPPLLAASTWTAASWRGSSSGTCWWRTRQRCTRWTAIPGGSIQLDNENSI